MARATLASIITIVRGLVNDTAGAGQIFTDDEIQAALDARRDEARYVKMNEKPTIASGGQVSFLTYDAPVGMWEDGVVIVNQSFAVQTPLTTDLINGRWTFTTQPLYPIMMVGFTHDVWGASADILREWSRRESLAFDVSANGTGLQRSQKATMLQDRATEYLAKARTRSSDLVRTDEQTDPRPTFADAYPY